MILVYKSLWFGCLVKPAVFALLVLHSFRLNFCDLLKYERMLTVIGPDDCHFWVKMKISRFWVF